VFFNVVALESGYYPVRITWFQSQIGVEGGLLLEFSSIEDQEVHLVNLSTDPMSKGAFLAGPLLGEGPATPVVSMQPNGTGLTLQWTGQLQVATDPMGPWTGVAFDDESPMPVDTQQGDQLYFRSRSF
jgi:hypothetical protein